MPIYDRVEINPNVIFLRYPVVERYQIAHDLVELVKQQNEKLIGCFVTITPKRIRIARLPQTQNTSKNNPTQ